MPIMYSKVTTEPTSEPITLKEAKTHCHVDHNEEDQLITILIQAARETVEQETNRSLITQTRTMKLDYFPRYQTSDGWGQIILPYGPVSSVSSITYVDENEASQTLSSSDYWTDFTSNIPRVIVKNSWPGTFTMPNAVTVVYVAGYGSATSVPHKLISAIKILVKHLFDNREVGQESGSIVHEMPYGFKELISTYVLEHSMVY